MPCSFDWPSSSWASDRQRTGNGTVDVRVREMGGAVNCGDLFFPKSGVSVFFFRLFKMYLMYCIKMYNKGEFSINFKNRTPL